MKNLKIIALLLFACTLFTCNKNETYINLPIYGPAQLFYALTDQNTIASYNAKDVRNAIARVNISGLAASEIMLDFDFRPATGELYGVTNQSRLYIIDVTAGNTKLVATAPFSPAINGIIANIDFDPTADRIRLVSNTGQNLRINPETGLVEGTDTNVNNTGISGIAFSNSYAGATSTTLYNIDAATNKLYKQDPQNAGTLTAIGNLNVIIGNNSCFDISPDNINALAIGKVGDSTKLYGINTATGQAALAGKFALGTTIRSIAIPANPVIYTIDQSNNLIIFNPDAAVITLYTKPISGLQTGETIYGIDMRPANGILYALGSSNRLYMLNIGTGAATSVGVLTTSLVGTSFGFDFNPLADAIRVVSNTGQNLRVNPNTAAVTVDANITLATATFSAAAYANNFRTASSTALYVIDYTVDKLYRQEPNTGVLTEIGALKVDVTAINGFDIVYANGDNAFGIFTVGSKTSLYTVSLVSGEAKIVFDFPKVVTGLTFGLKI